MKKLFGFMAMGVIALTSCGTVAEQTEQPWIVDRFDDIKVIRYEVPGFENLSLEEKELIYYLGEAAKCGRDILFDQNFKYNLAVRRTLEAILFQKESPHFNRTTSPIVTNPKQRYDISVTFTKMAFYRFVE